MPIGDDLTSWQFWWDYNQDNHLLDTDRGSLPISGSDDFYLGATRTRQTQQTMRPGRAVLVGEILPALKHAVDQGPRGVTNASMLALARIGIDHPEFRLFDVIAARLSDQDQTTRETAAVALGLAGQSDQRCLSRLLEVVRDESAADNRTRSFAAYGLGLLAERDDNVTSKRRVFDAMREVLDDRELRSRDLRVAALQAISLLNINRRKYEGARLAAEVIACLDAFFQADLGKSEQHLQAHCPTAIARLLRNDHRRSERHKEWFAKILSGRAIDGKSRASRRVSNAITQSCALALGQLCRPNEDGDIKSNRDVRYSEVLLKVWRQHKDAQTRNFALVALGQIGGKKNRDALLREFDKASPSIEQPWCAIALGLCKKAGNADGGGRDALIDETLLAAFARAKNPETVSALAISMGLAATDASGHVMRQQLGKSLGQQRMAQAICQGLGLLGDKLAIEPLHEMVKTNKRQPQLIESAAVALGSLGDPTIGEVILRRFVAGEPSYGMQVALSRALADVGDRRHVQPLLAVLSDTNQSAITRAGAARALGGIADPRELRWNSPLRTNANYRANVATLTDRIAGVLDIR